MANPAQGAATREVNADLAIDFEQGLKPEQLQTTAQRRRRRNVHVVKLHQIVEAIGKDEAEIDELYRIACFSSEIGAAAARRTMKQHQEDWPELLDGYEFEVKSRVQAGTSELWAGVMQVQPADVELEPEPEPDPDENPVDEDDESTDEEGFYDRELEITDDELDEIE